jgi:hypothetical protein
MTDKNTACHAEPVFWLECSNTKLTTKGEASYLLRSHYTLDSSLHYITFRMTDELIVVSVIASAHIANLSIF